ncbi:MAG: transposase [Lachnospiraceae bacterium]|nr:transposase [Lachnospiraceae bacterium]
MSRTHRIKSHSGLYHIILRGMDRRIIFLDDMDRTVFLKAVKRAKAKSHFKLYAYCLMDNHVHMLIKEEDEPLEVIFKRIGVSYVSYFNKKYDLYGHLYQDRFRSEPVDSYTYFLDVLRYICHNPIKAGLCSSPKEYIWLECSRVRDHSGLIDDIDDFTSLTESEMADFILDDCSNIHMDSTDRKRFNDTDALAIVKSVTGYDNPQYLGELNKNQLRHALQKCLERGISIRQLARITGISKSTIDRIKAKMRTEEPSPCPIIRSVRRL